MATKISGTRMWVVWLVAALALAVVGAATASKLSHGSKAPAAGIAQNGADDPAGDQRHGEGAGHAQNGADDPAGDQRHGEGGGHA